MTYRSQDGGIITGEKAEACDFAVGDAEARVDWDEYTVDWDEYGIAITETDPLDPEDPETICIVWEDVLDCAADSTRGIWGWDEFEREHRRRGGDELTVMQSGAVYSFRPGSEYWEYEFDVCELAEVEDGTVWPAPWTERRESEYSDRHPAQLAGVWAGGTELSFFVRP